jgi:ATP phosphoribosyltransferase
VQFDSVDLVESGETMRAAKLKPIATILETEAVLICNPQKHKTNPLIEKITRRIQGVLLAEQYVIVTYNTSRANLPAAVKITPGRRAPTISPLEKDDWVSVSAMVLHKKVGDVMDELTAAGAEDILVTSIHNCRVK